MKTPLILFIPALMFAQSFWSPAIQITPDSIEAVNPSFPDDGPWWGDPQVQWLAYTQISRGAMDIVAHRSTERGLAWNTTPTRITNDTVHDDFPSIAQLGQWSSRSLKMIVWERGENDIYFSRTNDTVWTRPSPLGTGLYGGRTPYTTIADTLCGAVWENRGRILFSEFRSNAWQIPVFLTTPNDTVNFLPQVKYFYGGNPYKYRPIVLWERRKRVSQDREIVWVTRTDSGWTLPDTVTSAGDCRHARFVSQTHPGSILISFESNRLGSYCIFGAWGSLGVAWSVDQQPISSNIAGTQQTSASFTLFPVITTSPSVPQAIRYTAGTWRIARDTGEDSIGLAVKALNTLVARSGGNGEDRNPVLSTGVNHGPIRVWSVWQNNAGGRWKLFGSYADIILDDVKEGGIVNAFHLHQNYPNPFNPSTTISFELKRPAHVLLKVFDILGREVATLTDERKDLGLHKVGLASRALGTGVYFYRLSVDGYQQTRKMIVVK